MLSRLPAPSSIRQTMLHLVASQRGYLGLLPLPVEQGLKQIQPLAFDELKESAIASGEALLNLLKDDSQTPKARLETTDGYYVEPRVVFLQIINHAAEHREQINSMLTALGLTPPDLVAGVMGNSPTLSFPSKSNRYHPVFAFSCCAST